MLALMVCTKTYTNPNSMIIRGFRERTPFLAFQNTSSLIIAFDEKKSTYNETKCMTANYTF